jgi:hypothetical protein
LTNTTTTDLIARLRRITKISYGATIEEAREVSQTLREAADLIARVIGDLPQDAIDGGWTALGMSRYAKGLETQIETLQRERDEAVAHADRWKWARAALISMRFMSGRHMSSETNICPCLDDDITSEYWDRVADTQRAAIKSGSEG